MVGCAQRQVLARTWKRRCQGYLPLDIARQLSLSHLNATCVKVAVDGVFCWAWVVCFRNKLLVATNESKLGFRHPRGLLARLANLCLSLGQHLVLHVRARLLAVGLAPDHLTSLHGL